MKSDHSSRRRPISGAASRWAAAVVAAAALSALTACGTSAGKAAPLIAHGAPTSSVAAGVSTNSKDPCALLTQSEVDTAAGQPLSPGKAISVLDDCQWTNSDFTATIDVSVSDWTAIKNAATENGTKTPPAVAGIGDEALLWDGLLYVRKGNDGFLLSFDWPTISSSTDHGLAQAKVLAGAVLARL